MPLARLMAYAYSTKHQFLLIQPNVSAWRKL